jgi:hypothetical protein
VSLLVWSGVGPTCGYYRVVVSGCVQSSVLYISMYKVAKSRQYTYSLSISVHVHVEVCSSISSIFYSGSLYLERFVGCDVLRLRH